MPRFAAFLDVVKVSIDPLALIMSSAHENLVTLSARSPFPAVDGRNMDLTVIAAAPDLADLAAIVRATMFVVAAGVLVPAVAVVIPISDAEGEVPAA